MVTITPTDAVAAVRKNMDEQEINASALYVSGSPDTTDNDSLDSIIKKTLPEAINAVHRDAEHVLLEGVDATVSGVTISNNTVSFSVAEKVLRLVSFKAVDSSVIVGDYTPEFSAEGRKQFNEYIRGTFDDPVLVKVEGKSMFRYYTIKDATASTYAETPASTISECKIVPEVTYAAAAVSYNVSTLLRETALLHLTGMVLSIYGETDKAKYFFDKASSL